MKKHTAHRQTLRNRHPIHWHGSMYLAIAAILLATVKSSSELTRALEQQVASTANSSLMSNIFQREAENPHLPVILTSGIRHASVGSR